MRACEDCGAFGHRKGSPSCPAFNILKRQDPYHKNPPRPPAQAVSDPADRDANEHTVFLIPPKRMI